MKKKVSWLLVSVLMIAALLLASCGPAEEEEEEVVTPGEEEEVVTEEEEEVVTEEKEMVIDSLGRRVEKPKYGGVAVIARSSPIIGFDEIYSPNYQVVTTDFTHEELLTGDWVKGPAGTNEISWVGSIDYAYDFAAGGVAESWEIIDDRTVRFKIQKGIYFALDPGSEASQLVGGRELNAHDVVYSLKRSFLSPGAYMQVAHTAAEKEGWDAWAEDDWTVIHQWNPGLARVLFEFSDYCYIIAEEVIEEYGDMKDWRVAVGTGPFIMVDHIDASSTTFIRNPNYWKKHPLYPEDTMPYLDGIKLLVIPDVSTRLSALRTGKIDALSANWEDADSLIETNPQLEYMRYLVSGSPISMRMDNPDLPWYDKRVRHALSLAINNQEFIDGIYGGHGEILAHPILPYPRFMDMYTPLEELPESIRELFGYDPEKAKQLLAEAGYPDGFQAKVLTTATSADNLAVIKDYWEKIGVELLIDVREATVFAGMTVRKKQEEMIYGTAGSGANQPSKFSNYYSVGYLNYSRIDDPVLNETIEKIDAMGWEFYTNPAKFNAILKDVYPYILEESWHIAMPGYYSYRFWWPWMKDYNGVGGLGYLNGSNYLNYIWIDQDLKDEMTGK